MFRDLKMTKCQYMYVHTTDSSLNTNLEIFLPHV